MQKKRIGLLFPGQGAQYVGMGQEFCQNYPVAAQRFLQAREILGYDLAELCSKGPEEVLNSTEYCQPAIFVASVAAFEVCKEVFAWNDMSSFMFAGLSLGEYTALYAAGALSFEDGLRLVGERARLMDEACRQTPGAMASVLGLEKDVIEAYLREAFPAREVQVANLNCPGQIVISGQRDRIPEAVEALKDKGARRAVGLKVSGAFHSLAMQPAADALAGVMAGMVFNDSCKSVLSNFRGDFYTGKDEVPQLLLQQLTGSVRWQDCVEKMITAGVEVFFELGCSKVLTNLFKRIDSSQEVYPIENEATLKKTMEVLHATQ